MALDDSLAEGHAWLGFIKMLFEYDWSGAEAEFRRAMALDPTYTWAHRNNAILYQWRRAEVSRRAYESTGRMPTA